MRNIGGDYGGGGGGVEPGGGEGFGLPGRFPTPPHIRVGFKKGGKVKKTGKYKLHKGEQVLTKAQQKKRKKSDTHAFIGGRRA